MTGDVVDIESYENPEISAIRFLSGMHQKICSLKDGSLEEKESTFEALRNDLYLLSRILASYIDPSHHFLCNDAKPLSRMISPFLVLQDRDERLTVINEMVMYVLCSRCLEYCHEWYVIGWLVDCARSYLVRKSTRRILGR